MATEPAWPPPPWIRRAARRLPDRPNDEGPTHGIAFTHDGRPLSAQPLRSGKNVASTSGLRPLPGKNGWPWPMTDHVEPIVAAQMRRPNAPTAVSLVLNKQPCTDDPYSCDQMLRHLIPAGSVLMVYVRDPRAPEGVTPFRAYHGTGKGVAS
jgi:hypothetical protein